MSNNIKILLFSVLPDHMFAHNYSKSLISATPGSPKQQHYTRKTVHHQQFRFAFRNCVKNLRATAAIRAESRAVVGAVLSAGKAVGGMTRRMLLGSCHHRAFAA